MGDVGLQIEGIAHDGGDAEMYEAGHAAWSTLTALLIGRFQIGASRTDLRNSVEATIVELASEQLWNDLGERAAWDRFDVERWSACMLVLDGSYRRRARNTLGAFFGFLADIGRVSRDVSQRIQHEIDSRLSDHTLDSAMRHQSSVRFKGDAEQDPQAPELIALAQLRRRG